LNDWENYKHTRNNYNKLIKNTIKAHFSNDIQNNKGNLKKTWKSISSIVGTDRTPFLGYRAGRRIIKNSGRRIIKNSRRRSIISIE
jgi:hypothetical protein